MENSKSVEKLHGNSQETGRYESSDTHESRNSEGGSKKVRGGQPSLWSGSLRTAVQKKEKRVNLGSHGEGKKGTRN